MIPTAETFRCFVYKENPQLTKQGNENQRMIEFASLHVQEALANRDRLYETYYEDEITFSESNKEFIRKSYPLTNIK